MESISRGTSITAASIFSIMGGALMVIGGLVALSMAGMWMQKTVIPRFGMGGMMIGEVGGVMPSSVMWGAAAVGVMFAISAGLGAILIVGGYSIQKSPESTSKWWVAVLVASVISLFGMGGFFIGPMLGIIGGILALTKR